MNDVSEPLIDLPDAPGERPAVVICHDHGTELADLIAVLEAAGKTLAPGRVDRRRLGLFGQGLGGGNAILAASRSPWRDRVRALVTWSAIVDVDLSGLTAPWLSVQGGEDETVPVAVSGPAGPRERLVIPGAGHIFVGRHPFTGPTPHLIQALNATQRWFRAHP